SFFLLAEDGIPYCHVTGVQTCALPIASKVPILLLEPVDEMEVLVADEYVGPIMSDLTSRRGRVQGSQAVPGGRTMIKAEVPQLEITRYAIDLRSMSQGTGTFSRRCLRDEPLPTHLAEKVAAGPKDS